MKTSYPLRVLHRYPEGPLFSLRAVAILLLLSLVASGLPALSGQTYRLQKAWQHRNSKTHPFAPSLSKPLMRPSQAKGAIYNRLLVILVEFQEELTDDPNTTGNGKFQTQPDPAYLYSIGSPPHDREYFLANLEALRYYYQAVSNGSYDLQYDVYPQDGSKIVLSRPMGYYNPPGVSAAVFTQRMEEYFAESFTLADQQCPQIDFSSYGHYMIIHAGSDWQHDINGDTPSDIPSFFIRVGDEKAVSVDGGTHLIRHACNVPATISQDFAVDTSGSVDVHSGYGALNAVIAHEFGHSLGLVDLYNVYNFQPMVGVFDLMDSGGSGVLVDQLNDGSLVMVEGILPALPGAFSRALLFEDWYRQNGYMKDVADVNMNSTLQLAASSMKQTSAVKPHIYKIPLSAKEYVLIENRSVDPDNDGATAVYGTLDGRVILYPTPINDPTNQPSYEYDYLLPSFQRPNGDAVGGGVLAWYVNEAVLYDQGMIYSDGSWASNFDNNSVNTSYANRGVRVIEADGLADIGNAWSWYWTGTQYEYFHKAKPVLNNQGYFQNWSLTPWKPVLGPSSQPPLVDGEGIPSLFWLAEISNPGAIMSFEFRSGFFTGGKRIGLQPESVVAPLIDTSFDVSQIPVVGPGGVRLFSTDSTEWADLMGEFSYSGEPSRFPITRSTQTPNPYHELVLTLEDRIRIIEFWDDALDQTDIDLGSGPVLQPLASGNQLFCATSDAVYLISDNAINAYVSVSNPRRLAMAGDDLLIVHPSGIALVSHNAMSNTRTYSLPGRYGAYEPVVFRDETSGQVTAFIMSDDGDIWRYSSGKTDRIFTNRTTDFPTQMGIISTIDHCPVLFFGVGSRVYALLADGTLLDGFPYQTDNLNFEPVRHVYALKLGDEYVMQLPVPGRGYAAVSIPPSHKPALSMSLPYVAAKDQMHFDAANGLFYWYFIDSGGDLCYQWLSTTTNPIIWAGARNSADGQFTGVIRHPAPGQNGLNAYVYPNPVLTSPLRLRAENLSSHPIQINVFDASGALVLRSSFDSNGVFSRDFQLDHKLASGVYFLTLSNGTRHKRVKFAVIN